MARQTHRGVALLTTLWRKVNWHTWGVATFKVNLVVAILWSLLVLAFFQFFNGTDFFHYRSDALHAWTNGWGTYYGNGDSNIYPPLQGFIMLPFLPLSPQLGFFLWTLLSIGCWFLVWWLAGERRWWHLPIFLLLPPFIFTLLVGQVVAIVAAIVTLAWWLSNRQKGFAAGVVLSLATLKPQVIFLLPLVLLLAGRKREFVGFAVGALVIGLASLSLIGTQGIAQMLAEQHGVLVHPHDFAVANTAVLIDWFPGILGVGLTVAAVLLTLGIAYKIRGAATGLVFAVGIFGSLLVTPYLHQNDLVMWVVAGLLLLRTVGLPRGLAGAGLFVSWLVIFGVPLVSLGGLLVALRNKALRTGRLNPGLARPSGSSPQWRRPV